MKFKYQLHTGNPTFFTWITLHFQAFLLLLIRFLRLCKRILIYSKRYIPVFFCIILFEIIIIPIGIHFGKYAAWIDGVWDLRNFFLTSILISFVGGVLQVEYKRHKELIKQFQAYKTFMSQSVQFINKLCLLIGIEISDNIFLNEELYRKFLSRECFHIGDCTAHSNREPWELSAIQDPYFIYSTPQLKNKHI